MTVHIKRFITSGISLCGRPMACKARNWGYLENWKSTAPAEAQS